MGTSFQAAGTKSQSFKDSDLVAVVSLMADAFASLSGTFPEFMPTMKSWERKLAGSGPGTIDLELSEVAASRALRRDFLGLLSIVESHVRQSGGTFPAALLNECSRVPDIVFFDYPTERIIQTIDKLRRLVAE